jgi:hypothetical protein
VLASSRPDLIEGLERPGHVDVKIPLFPDDDSPRRI